MEYIECTHYKMDLSTFTEDDLYKILLYEDTRTQTSDMLEALPVYLSYFTNPTSPFHWRFAYRRVANKIDFYLHSAFDDALGIQIDLIPLVVGIELLIRKDELIIRYRFYDETIQTSAYNKEELDKILNPTEEEGDDNEEVNLDDGSAS